MRYLRAALGVGGLVWLAVWSLWMAGVFVPWDEALHRFSGLSGRSDAFHPAALLVLCALLALGTAWTTIDIPKPALKAVVAAAALAQVIAFFFVAALFGLHFPVFPAALSVMLAYLGGSWYGRTLAGGRKRLLRAVLGDRLSRENFRRLLDAPHNLPLEGGRAGATVLVCELFHPNADADRSPVEEVGCINRFLARAAARVTEAGGYVDECDGEGLRALFVAPLTPGDPAVRALETALDLASWDAGIDCRIGIETDEVTLGMFGSPETGRFGASGPSLEFARRLARWNLRFGTRVLAGPGLFGVASAAFRFRPAAVVPPPWCPLPAEVYEPLVPVAAASDADPRLKALSLFWEGVVLFREARWHEALNRLTQARDLSGPDPLCDFYLARAKAALGGDGRAGDLFGGEPA